MLGIMIVVLRQFQIGKFCLTSNFKLHMDRFAIVLLFALLPLCGGASHTNNKCNKCEASFPKHEAKICQSCVRLIKDRCCFCGSDKPEFVVMLCHSCSFGRKNCCCLCNNYFPVKIAKCCSHCNK